MPRRRLPPQLAALGFHVIQRAYFWAGLHFRRRVMISPLFLDPPDGLPKGANYSNVEHFSAIP